MQTIERSVPITSDFVPKQGKWDAAAFFDDLTRADVAFSDERIEELRDYFWFDLCAEYDAAHLHDYLAAHENRFSPEFRRYEQVWWRDEMNHANGFRRLYSMLYGESDVAMDARLADRRPDFSVLEADGFFDDEFRLTLLFAYDELATTRAYHLDFELYREMGHPRFLAWIKATTRDESFHMQNAIALVRLLHRDRVAEIPAHVDDFVRYDLGGHRYRATFLFDHEWDHVSPQFYRENASELMKYFDLRRHEPECQTSDESETA